MFFEKIEEWNDHQKQTVIIAAGECGYQFDLENDEPDDLDVDIYEHYSLRELAIEFVEEGLLGDIPEPLQFYIDYDAIALDLRADYTETAIAGQNLVYRCG